jgi:hypothetical protein
VVTVAGPAALVPVLVGCLAVRTRTDGPADLVDSGLLDVLEAADPVEVATAGCILAETMVAEVAEVLALDRA